MIISIICFFVIGIIVGYAWGLEVALKKPEFAEGFLRGFYRPIETIKFLLKEDDR